MLKDEYIERNNSKLDKLVLAVGFFAFLAALIIGVLTYYSSRDFIKSEIFEDNLRTAYTIANFIERDTVSDPKVLKKNVNNLWDAYSEKLSSSFVCVIDSSGRLILNSKRPEKIGVFVGDVKTPGKDKYVNTISKLLKKKGDWVGYNLSHAGTHQLAAYTYSRKLGGLIAVHADAEQVNAEIDGLVFPWVLGWAIFLFVLFPAALLLSRKLFTNSRNKLIEATQILYEKDQQFKNLFETAREGIIIHNKDGKILNGNNAALQIFGLSDFGNISELKVTEFFENEKDKEMFTDVLSGSGYFSRSELRILRKSDQAVRLISISASCNTNNLTSEVICQSIFTDITERMELEKNLQISKEQFSHISTSAGVVPWQSKGNRNIIEQIGPQAEIIFGYPSEYWLREGFWMSIIHPEDRINIIKNLKGGLSEKSFYSLTYRIKDRDGNFKFVEDYVFRESDEAGEAILKGYLVDVSLRKQAEDQKEELGKRYEALIEQASDAIFLSDVSGQYVMVNKAAENLTGYSTEELLGKNMRDLIDPESIKEEPLMLKELSEGKVIINRRKMIHKDGSKIETEISAKMLEDGTLQGMVRNISDRIQYEKALKNSEENIKRLNEDLEKRVEERTQELKVVNQELEAFSYSVSHDLRAPLRAIDGFAKILELEYGKKLDAEAMRLIKIIRKNSDQMSVLVDDLLEFAKTAKMAPVMEEIAIGSLVHSILRTEIIEKNMDIEIQIAELPIMLGDRNLMKQVWVNLINNSIKFTTGKPKRLIKIYGSETDLETLYVIEDNGVGFNDQYANKIFDVFHRLHNTNEFPGTGVGLAIVQRIIHRHKGVISAEGKENEGAKFYIAIPKQFNV